MNFNQYFKEAKTWADDNFGRIKQSRNRYQAAFLVSMGLNALAIIAVATLSHYQTLVPLLIHHYENGITTVSPVNNNNAPINIAQTEHDIVQYIQYREAYDASSYRAQFELVGLLSNNNVNNEYIAEQDKSSAPIRLLGNNIKREVHIYSINFLDSILKNSNDIHQDHHNLAEVVFNLIDTDKTTNHITESHFNALIAWRYTTPPTSPAARWQNWDGFEVIRYTKQPRNKDAV